MNSVKQFCFLVYFVNFVISAQEPGNTGLPAQKPVSRIIRSTEADSVLVKLEILNGSYFPAKENLPFIIVSKTTSYNQEAAATLVVKSVQPVAAEHQRVILKTFYKYLTHDFELIPRSSYSRQSNLNHYSLVPFRLNSRSEVEELTGYEINWSISENNARFKAAAPFKTQSVLSSGSWYKIAITDNGIHKITRTFLNNAGINTSNLDPRNIRIYGNGGAMLPELNGDPRTDDLEENPIVVAGESDGRFDNNDYILFYASGTTSWKKTGSASGLKFKAQKSYYSDTSFYFINTDLGPGKRLARQSSGQLTANVTTSTYDYYNFHEDNVLNFGKTGREFYGEYFDINTSYKFSWNDGDFVTNDTIIAETILLGQGAKNTEYVVSGNKLYFGVSTGSITPGASYPDYATLSTGTQKALNDNPTELNIQITKTSAQTVGWLDKLTVNARRTLRVNTQQFNFRDSRIAAPGNICRFILSNPALADIQVWNITSPLNPFVQEFSQSGAQVEFTATSDSMNEYCVAPSTDFHTPVFVGKVANQNLHAIQQADYVIVTHPLFLHEAQRIGALHSKIDGLSYVVATIDQVYNEFSSGMQDIAAIRDFIRMIYSRGITSGRELKYVLLFGDGSYNNKTRSLVNNSNFIPTYQTPVTLSSTQSVASDDFYALMDANEGRYAEDIGAVDIGVGRFTCKTPNEAKGIVDKIEHYYSRDPNFQVNTSTPENCNNLNETPMGDWRNWLLFLADDGNDALHMYQSDSLTRGTLDVDPTYNIDKIFLDAYQRVSTPGGSRYPGAAEDFLKRIRKGALIFNYTGHGGEVGLTAERLIDLAMINSLDNYNKLPLFITATCEFSRYDDPGRTSAGELTLLNPKGGAIALMTTSRLAYAEANMRLNMPLLSNMFSRLPGGKRPALGDIVRISKSSLGQQFTYANFHLLGDPALTLAYPELKVLTSTINGKTATVSASDTLAALTKITVTGFVADTSGNKLTGFNGLVYPTVFDKEQKVVCLLNSFDSNWTYYGPGGPFIFNLQKNMLYRGKARVTNGEFSFTFLVPKDVSYAPGPGKISYYATNGVTDAAGTYSNIIVGGESKNSIQDDTGPQVHLFLNDKNFVPGGLTNEKPVFYADLTDSSGINTVGTGLGHDISVVMDEQASKPIIMNDFYEADLNSYQSGRVRYPFNELSVGQHRLTFKVWDILNNSNTVHTDFIVAESAELALKQVLNYPNPFTTSTKFMFEHNQACNPLKVTIQIYTVSGKMVKTIQRSVLCEGFRPEAIEWDGRDDYGDKLARGVYIYRLGILDINNKKAEKIEKLVILN